MLQTGTSACSWETKLSGLLRRFFDRSVLDFWFLMFFVFSSELEQTHFRTWQLAKCNGCFAICHLVHCSVLVFCKYLWKLKMVENCGTRLNRKRAVQFGICAFRFLFSTFVDEQCMTDLAQLNNFLNVKHNHFDWFIACILLWLNRTISIFRCWCWFARPTDSDDCKRSVPMHAFIILASQYFLRQMPC